jgi:hypothetical protein
MVLFMSKTCMGNGNHGLVLSDHQRKAFIDLYVEAWFSPGNCVEKGESMSSEESEYVDKIKAQIEFEKDVGTDEAFDRAEVMEHYLNGGEVEWRKKYPQPWNNIDWNVGRLGQKYSLEFNWDKYYYRKKELPMSFTNNGPCRECGCDDPPYIPVSEDYRNQMDDLICSLLRKGTAVANYRASVVSAYLGGKTVYWRSRDTKDLWKPLNIGKNKEFVFSFNELEYSLTNPDIDTLFKEGFTIPGLDKAPVDKEKLAPKKAINWTDVSRLMTRNGRTLDSVEEKTINGETRYLVTLSWWDELPLTYVCLADGSLTGNCSLTRCPEKENPWDIIEIPMEVPQEPRKLRERIVWMHTSAFDGGSWGIYDRKLSGYYVRVRLIEEPEVKDEN